MPLRWVSQSSRYRRCDVSAVRQTCHSSMAAGLAVWKLPLPSSSDSPVRRHLALGSERAVRFCPRGGRELMKFTAIHVDWSRGQHAVSEPVSCRGDPPPLKGKQLRHGGSPIRPAWRVLHKPAGWRATGSQTHSRAAAEVQTDNHYHSLPHRHKHTTPEAQCWACAKPTSMRYSIPAAGAGRPPCSETSSRLRHCADSLSLGGGKRHGRRVSRAPTGAAASRPRRQLALACDRRADAIGLACFYGNQTLGSGHGINTGLRVRPHSGGGGSRWPASPSSTITQPHVERDGMSLNFSSGWGCSSFNSPPSISHPRPDLGLCFDVDVRICPVLRLPQFRP